MTHHLCSYSNVRSTQIEIQAGESLVILSYTRRIRKNEEKRYTCSMIKMADNIQAMLHFCVEESEAGLCAQETGPLGSQSKQQYTTLFWMPSLLHILHWRLFSLRDGKCLSQNHADGSASTEGVTRGVCRGAGCNCLPR